MSSILQPRNMPHCREFEVILGFHGGKTQSIDTQLKESYAKDLQSLFKLFPKEIDMAFDGKTINLS